MVRDVWFVSWRASKTLPWRHIALIRIVSGESAPSLLMSLRLVGKTSTSRVKVPHVTWSAGVRYDNYHTLTADDLLEATHNYLFLTK